MPRALMTLVAAGMAFGLTAGPALAMQPPAEAAADRFGCVAGEDNAVAGQVPLPTFVHWAGSRRVPS